MLHFGSEKSEWKIEEENENQIKNELVGGKNKCEILINLYEAEQRKLYEHFLAISGLDVDILESINIQNMRSPKMQNPESNIILENCF